MKVLILLYICIALVAAALVYCVYLLVKDGVQERIRRKRHPKWWELWDRALSNAFCIGGKFHDMSETINKRSTLVHETYFAGKCTEDEYREAMKTIADDYVQAVQWYKTTKTALGIEEDLKEADTYARENNLEWGILY